MNIIGQIKQEDIDESVKIIDLLMKHGYRLIEAARFCCSYNAYYELLELLSKHRKVCRKTIEQIIDKNQLCI
jgi:hypothetical protein